MARVPRDVDAADLIKKLERYGYVPTRQSGSHIRLTRIVAGVQQHVTLPNHKPLRLGTLNGILGDVAAHLGKDKGALVAELFG